MVADASGLLAILLDEPERRRFNEAIEDDPIRFVSAVTLVEASMVLQSRGGKLTDQDLDDFLRRSHFRIVSVDEEQAQTARDAFRRFGKGRHPAGLNFGDCFAYALAKVTGEPLLYKGNDFSQTDISAAV